MTDIILMKLLILALCWIAGWTIYFANQCKPANLKNMSIAFAPILIYFMWFMIFVW